jgi:ChrR Cupin-like domain
MRTDDRQPGAPDRVRSGYYLRQVGRGARPSERREDAVPKTEREFFRPDDLPWEPVAGSATGGSGGPGVTQKILSRDPESGDVTRLLKFDAGTETAETITHDFWEEVWILEGEITDLGKGQRFTAGMYACRPPGMVHGPYRVAAGCTMFEVRYFRR